MPCDLKALLKLSESLFAQQWVGVNDVPLQVWWALTEVMNEEPSALGLAHQHILSQCWFLLVMLSVDGHDEQRDYSDYFTILHFFLCL